MKEKRLSPKDYAEISKEKQARSPAEALAFAESILANPLYNKSQTRHLAQYTKARFCFIRCHYDEAEALVKPLIFAYLNYPFDPVYVGAFSMMGILALSRNHHYLAIFYIDQALALADHHHLTGYLSMLYSNLSDAYHLLKDLPKSYECIQKALAYFTNYEDADLYQSLRFNEAIVLIELKRFDEAESLLNDISSHAEEAHWEASKRNGLLLTRFELNLAAGKLTNPGESLREIGTLLAGSEVDFFALEEYKDLVDYAINHHDENLYADYVSRIEAFQAGNPQKDIALYLAKVKAQHAEQNGQFEEAAKNYRTAFEMETERGLAAGQELEEIVDLRQRLLSQNQAYLKAKKRNRRLREATNTDLLTGLPNRRALNGDARRLGKRIQGAKVFGCALLDLDAFKWVDDTYGYLTGDDILKAIATRFKEMVGSTLKIYRYGGDEFLLLYFSETSEEIISSLKGLALKLLGTNFLSDSGNPVIVTASIGYVVLEHSYLSLDNAIDLASAKLREAKKSGRGALLGEER